MANSIQSVAELMVGLEARFIPHDSYREIKEHFEMLFHRRIATLNSGVFSEASGIAIIGASGCGKTTCIEQIIKQHMKTHPPMEGSQTHPIVSVSIPSQANVKALGEALLTQLGYKMEGRATESQIWRQVRFMLKELKVLFLFIDETQHIVKSGTPKEMQAVVNTLKTIMQTRDWPVNLILSGPSELTKILNFDAQLGRRVLPVAFNRLDPVFDQDRIETYLSTYADQAGLNPEAKLFEYDFIARLVFAADREFGYMIRRLQWAIENCLLRNGSTLLRQDFVDAFAKRSGCIGAANPFIAIEYERLNVRLVLQEGPEEVNV